MPIGIVNELEKVSRRFFYGAKDGERQLHMLKWNKIYRPKEDGGLGIPPLRMTNLTFLMKLTWRLLTGTENLSSRIVRDKYGLWRKLLEE